MAPFPLPASETAGLVPEAAAADIPEYEPRDIPGFSGRLARATAFTLTKGQGTAVCDAYLARLNATNFHASPLCGRPEDTRVEGFERLRRVDIGNDPLYEISDYLLAFVSHGDQLAFAREREQLLAVCERPNPSPPLQEICRTRQREKQAAEAEGERWHSFLSRSDVRTFASIVAWRYEPEVDIDNDGRPDRILMFHEGRCGGGRDLGEMEPRATYAYVMNDHYGRIDEQGTREIFGHPQPEWPGVKIDRFRYVGAKLGIMKYRGEYYFDTFFTSLTDFQGRRLGDETLPATLGVFRRKGGVTVQACEYRYDRTVR